MLAQSVILVPLAGIAALVLAWRGLDARERRFVSWAWLAHVAATFGLVVYHEYIFMGGDMDLYTGYGRDVARLMRFDLARYAPEALNLTLQRETVFPFSVLLEGTSTASMMGLTSFAMLLFGDSIFAVCLVFSFFAFLGSVSMYKAVRFKLTAVERVPVLIGVLLVPSVVFWSSGIVKEAVVLGGLGTVLKAISDTLVRRRMLAIVTMAPSVALIALIKPYVFVPLVLGFGAWFYAGRGQKLSLGYKLLGIAIAAAGMMVVAAQFPAYSFDRVGETIAHTQQNFVQANQGAGSGIQIGDVDTAAEEQTLARSLKWAPLGLLNALARPMLFDIRNVTLAIAALEMTALIWAVLSLLRRHGVRRVIREISSEPPFLFSAVFVLALGISVGLATGNLGTLSRYRVPMMPMYVATVLALRARLDGRLKQRAGSANVPTNVPAKPALAPVRRARLTKEELIKLARRTSSVERSRFW